MTLNDEDKKYLEVIFSSYDQFDSQKDKDSFVKAIITNEILLKRENDYLKNQLSSIKKALAFVKNFVKNE